MEKISKLDIGESIVLGFYYEPIEWVAVDKEENRILLLSKNVLESKEYNKKFENVCWQNSSLRKWLNGVFLIKTFNEDEKKLIAETEVSTPHNPKYKTSGGNDTKDKIFLLSIEEAEKYLKTDDKRKAFPMGYAKEMGVWFNESDGNSPWWLRSTGIDMKRAAIVSTQGYIYEIGTYVDFNNVSVRPAMWIDISKIK